jgi:ribose 5-phosphate isomerase B
MRIAIAADERVGIAGVLAQALRERGHEVSAYGALADARPHSAERRGPRGENVPDGADVEGDSGSAGSERWAWAAEDAARAVAEGRAEQAVVCCWTGTGASIAANKVAGVRAALCADAATAAGARRWNDANALALSLRRTSEAELHEILDAWFATAASDELEDRRNVAHLAEIERRESTQGPPRLRMTSR